MPPVFSADINWDDDFVEDLECETNIVVMHDDTEWREALLVTPNTRFSYLVTALTQREASWLEAFIYAYQGKEVWVPYWRSARYLATAKSIGQTTLAVDTTGLGFVATQGVMFWGNFFNAEVATLSAVTDSLLTFSALTQEWTLTQKPRVRVIPAFLAQMSVDQNVSYEDVDIRQAQLIFDVSSYGD